jgi:agmatine/peptidylarginine deiminase
MNPKKVFTVVETDLIKKLNPKKVEWVETMLYNQETEHMQGCGR